MAFIQFLVKTLKNMTILTGKFNRINNTEQQAVSEIQGVS